MHSCISSSNQTYVALTHLASCGFGLKICRTVWSVYFVWCPVGPLQKRALLFYFIIACDNRTLSSELIFGFRSTRFFLGVTQPSRNGSEIVNTVRWWCNISWSRTMGHAWSRGTAIWQSWRSEIHDPKVMYQQSGIVWTNEIYLHFKALRFIGNWAETMRLTTTIRSTHKRGQLWRSPSKRKITQRWYHNFKHLSATPKSNRFRSANRVAN